MPPRIENGRILLPKKHGDDGWYAYQPDQHFDVQRDLYLWSLNECDLEWIDGDPWISYLLGRNPDYPTKALQRELARVRERVTRMREDKSTPDTRGSDYSQQFNPVVTTALVNLMLGANDPGSAGNVLHSQVRYFDPEKRRAGLPDDVGALVEKITAAGIELTLVNVSQVEPRTVTVQFGAYAEHHADTVTLEGKTIQIDAQHCHIRLAPGAGNTLTFTIKRYAHQPTLAFPWDRGWMHKRP